MHIDFEGQCFRNALLPFAKELPRTQLSPEFAFLPEQEMNPTREGIIFDSRPGSELQRGDTTTTPLPPHPPSHLRPRQ